MLGIKHRGLDGWEVWLPAVVLLTETPPVSSDELNSNDGANSTAQSTETSPQATCLPVGKKADEIIPAMDGEIIPAMDDEIIPAMDEEIIPAMDEEITPAMDEEIIPAMDEEITPAMDEEIIPAMDEEIIPAMDEEITPAMDDEITEGGQIHSESDPNIGANSTANIPRRSTRNYTPQVPAALTANPKIKEVTQTSPIATAKQSRNKTTRALVTGTINSNRSETAPVVAATTAKPNRNGPTPALATTNNDKGGAALRRSGRSQPTKRKINDEALLKKRSRQKHVAALIRRKPLYEIPPESQGLPYLNIVSLKDVHPCWNLLEKLRPENGYTIGQNVRMNVKYGPTCGKIIQMCKPPGGEGIQVLIAKIWADHPRRRGLGNVPRES
ncbi:hypothetical protein VE00_09914 [Pseudogymnoascus sp. WSF 3629]|nr:hypothetical protein VE00_09914 [Pseudogymnoascus sp. WSF 3629]